MTNISNWIPTSEATDLIKDFIARGTYKKGEIKKSSYRWADPKDHSKGYLCRVMVKAAVQETETTEDSDGAEVVA